MKTNNFLSMLLTLAVLFATFTTHVMAEENIKVVLNGAELSFDVPPQLINNRTMVPMRKIFEALGATVDWNNSTQTITAKKDDIVIIMQIDNSVIKVSGKDITLDVAPQLVDNRTLVPVRAVAEGLAAGVKWDDGTQTVIITKEENTVTTPVPTSTTPVSTTTPDLNGNITAIDLEKQTDFICNAGAIITYGFDDMWNKTTGTGFDPFVKVVGKAYRQQTIFISPLYANFAMDKDGKAKVTFSITRKKSNGEEATIIKDAVAFEGKVMPKQIIKSVGTLEYMIDDTDPLGVYTFTIESKDVVGNKTTTNTFYVEFADYKYAKNEFKSDDELFNFVYNYAKNPNPDRIIDAIVYTEKKEMMTYPVLLTAFIEMLGKNPYLAAPAIEVLEKELGKGGTETLKILESSASRYIQAIQENNPPTLTYVGVPKEIKNDIMMYGGCFGAYLASGSYDAAKVLATVLEYDKFSDDKLKEYMVPAFENIIETDPLFEAYCIYMQLHDTSVSKTVKDKLKTLLK
jgi:hypothetical protein